MKGGLVAIGLGLSLSLSIFGCRALVGIDDLESGGPGGPNGNNRDGGGNDEGGNNNALFDRCRNERECRMCCKQTGPEFRDTFELPTSPGAACLCQTDVCAQDCTPDGGQCQINPGDGGPNDCIRCIDDHFSKPNSRCKDRCGDNQKCRDIVACLEMCGGK